jgi:hypothetical protein
MHSTMSSCSQLCRMVKFRSQPYISTFASSGPTIMGLDDTIERRRGAKIKAKGIYRDPCAGYLPYPSDFLGFYAGISSADSPFPSRVGSVFFEYTMGSFG